MAKPEEMQFSTQVFGGVYCHNFNCQRPAKYAIGKNIGPISLKINICEECAKALARNMPLELLEYALREEPVMSGPTDAEMQEHLAQLSGANPVAIGALDPEVVNTLPSVFTCKHCGATFSANIQKINHEKKCKGVI